MNNYIAFKIQLAIRMQKMRTNAKSYILASEMEEKDSEF